MVDARPRQSRRDRWATAEMRELVSAPYSTHPQQQCRGQSSSLRSHHPRLSPSRQALLPAHEQQQEQSGVALERSLPLLQQEEEVFWVNEGIHTGNIGGKKTLNKTRTQTEGKTWRLLYLVRCSVTVAYRRI